MARAAPPSSTSPAATPDRISMRSERSSRTPVWTGSSLGLAVAQPQHPGARPAGVHRRRRDEDRLAALARHPALGKEARHELAAGVGHVHENVDLPGDRIGRRRDPLDVPLEGLPGIAAHLELDRRVDLERGERVRLDRRLKQHAGGVDDGGQQGPWRHDVAGVDRAAAQHAADWRRHHRIVELLPHRGEPRAGVGDLRLGAGHGRPGEFEIAVGQRAALDQVGRPIGFPFGDGQRLLGRAHGGLRGNERVLQGPRFDPREHRAALDRLAFLGPDLEHRARHLRADHGLARRPERSR